jgi:UDP-N-acetylglucosamine 1-carboxyvinyltransferase
MSVALIRVVGGQRLAGTVRAGGRKNSAVAVLPAALLGMAPVQLDNLPGIADVAAMIGLLQGVGARIEPAGPGSVRIDGAGLRPWPADAALASRLRASYYLIGVQLARFGEADVPLPGGCDIGLRPIDQHLKGFAAMGAAIELVHGRIRARAARLRGTHIYLDVTSVGATINLMLAACGAEGTTVLENAAKEPHVVDVASLLLAMGAGITGAGTDVIKVRGGGLFGGAVHAIIPDEIEAATFMIAAAGTAGRVRVDNVIPRHLEPVTAKLREAGVEVDEGPDSVEVRAGGRCRAVNIKTQPYPGFPTDAQQMMTALLSVAEGTSTVTETIWDGRFRFVDDLLRMGARIRVEGRTAVIQGVPGLSGAPVRAPDLRGAAALVLAGLFAAGETEVALGPYLDRGYEDLEGRLRNLGARIRREPAREDPLHGDPASQSAAR